MRTIFRNPFKYGRIVFILIVGLIISQADHIYTAVEAQDGSPSQLRVLVSGVDVNGQGFPLAIIDLGSGNARTLLTFANRSVCPPSVFPEGEILLYELSDAMQSYVYQVQVGTGERELLENSEGRAFSCPIVAPDGSTVAWLEMLPDDVVSGTTSTTKLVVVDTLSSEEIELAAHSTIFDVQWSPRGGALVYYTADPDSPFPQLYSVPRTGDASPRQFWAAGQGIIQDYLWTADSSGLLVTYYTEENLAVALLSSSCVIGPGDLCQPTPIALFSLDDNVMLMNAYSPRSRETLISLQTMDAQTGQLHTDLWILDLNGGAPPRQMTFTPSLIEADAYWASDGYIYFIGSQFDEDMQLLRGRVYRMADNEVTTPSIVFESSVFSPSAFLWWYN